MLVGAISAARDASRWDLVTNWIKVLKSRWPDNEMLLTMEAPSRHERDKQVADHHAARDEHIRRAWEAYECLPLSLTQLAATTGVSRAVLWEQIIARTDGTYVLRCHTGSVFDLIAQSDAARSAHTISVDMLALLSLELLGQLPLLVRMYDEVIVPNEAYFAIRSEVARVTESSTRYRLRNIIEFLSHQAKVRLVDGDDHTTKETDENPGVHVAADLVIPLLTDELAFQLAIRRQGGLAFSTYDLLLAARKKEMIDEHEYLRCLRILFAHSYVSLPVTPQQIVGTILADPRPSNVAVHRMLDRPIMGDIDYHRGSEALATVLWRLGSEWIAGCEDQRRPWVAAVLATAYSGNDDFRLQHCVYEFVRLSSKQPEADNVAQLVREVYDWFKQEGIDRTTLARSLGHAARDVGRVPQQIKAFLRKLTSKCPQSIQRQARLEALPQVN